MATGVYRLQRSSAAYMYLSTGQILGPWFPGRSRKSRIGLLTRLDGGGVLYTVLGKPTQETSVDKCKGFLQEHLQAHPGGNPSFPLAEDSWSSPAGRKIVLWLLRFYLYLRCAS
jgi:hypothetical protein